MTNKLTKLQIMAKIKQNSEKSNNILTSKVLGLANCGQWQFFNDQHNALFSVNNPIIKIVEKTKSGLKNTPKADLVNLYKDQLEYLSELQGYIEDLEVFHQRNEALTQENEVISIIEESLECFAIWNGMTCKEDIILQNRQLNHEEVYEMVRDLGHKIYNPYNIETALCILQGYATNETMKQFRDNFILSYDNRDALEFKTFSYNKVLCTHAKYNGYHYITN